MTFEDLGLGDKVLKAIGDAGYNEPTPIQAEAIPHVLMGKDVLGIAQTGTGKTASFTLPMIEILSQGRAKARMPRSLIVTPTRELAAQIAENFEIYGKYHKLTMALLIGGVSFVEQNKLLDRGVDVLIATPGRLLDQFERGKLLLSGIEVFVVDEADRMLDMGFIPDLERIFGLLPFTRQTLFFSATMPPPIQKITDEFLFAPARVEVARQATAAESITQEAVRCDRMKKRDVLRRLLKENDVKNAIIFCNRKRDVDTLERSLRKHGFNTAAIHGDLDQGTRTKTLASFKSGDVELLVASDVAARGLDIPDVTHVFNFDVPTHPEDYVHRIGRTGRAGKSGHAYTIVSPEDRKYLVDIEALLKKKIDLIELDGVAAADEGDDDKAAVEERPAGGRGRGGRSTRGGRGGRGGARRGRSETAEASAEEKPADQSTAETAEASSAETTASTPETNDGEERPRGRRRRGGRGRGRRDRSEGNQSEAATAETSSEPKAETETKPTAKSEAKSETRSERAEKPAERSAQKPARQPRSNNSGNSSSRNEKSGRDRSRRGGKVEQVKPAREELPAFLLRGLD